MSKENLRDKLSQVTDELYSNAMLLGKNSAHLVDAGLTAEAQQEVRELIARGEYAEINQVLISLRDSILKRISS